MPRKSVQAERKIQILEALDACLQEKPFDQTTIKDIANAAGINHGMLHYYFRSKEDILIHYIEYVIQRHKTKLSEWLDSKDLRSTDEKKLFTDFLRFMTDQITLNQTLSKTFIEIWEIAIYKPEVRARLRMAYMEWIQAVKGFIQNLGLDEQTSLRRSAGLVAYLEGLALFSVILDPAELNVKQVIDDFHSRVDDFRIET